MVHVDEPAALGMRVVDDASASTDDPVRPPAGAGPRRQVVQVGRDAGIGGNLDRPVPHRREPLGFEVGLRLAVVRDAGVQLRHLVEIAAEQCRVRRRHAVALGAGPGLPDAT
jgi:hypothetical protein